MKDASFKKWNAIDIHPKDRSKAHLGQNKKKIEKRRNKK